MESVAAEEGVKIELAADEGLVLVDLLCRPTYSTGSFQAFL